MNNYQVGQTLWFVPSDQRWYKPHEIIIESIGRKWIVSGRLKLDKESLRADSGQYQSAGRAYVSREVYEDKEALSSALAEFAGKIKWHQIPDGLTLEKLAQINALVFGEEQNE